MKTVLITGTNRGLGLEFVKQYLADGHRVIATHRSGAMSDELQNLKSNYSATLSIYELDVVNAESRKALSKALGNQNIHLLINNAGYYGEGNRLGQIDDQEWLKVFHVNCVAPVRLVEALRANLVSAGSSTVAFISSKMGSIADNSSGGSYLYRSSKAALNAAAKSLSIDLADEKIKVVMMHPGWVKTDMGGQNALIDAMTSIQGMRRVIDGLKSTQSGDFIAYDGTVIPW